MANTWSGFDGSVDETEDARRSQFQGSTIPIVSGSSANRVTANTGGTRSVNVSAGVSYAHGVRAAWDATSVGPLDAVTTPGQTRWDAVVIRRNWDANTVTLAVVKGVAAAAAPMALPDGLNSNIGVLHDQVLALVQITYNVTVPSNIDDRRYWAHKNLYAPSLAALPVASDAVYGLEACLPSGIRYRCMLDASNNPAWAVVGGNYTVLTQSSVLVSEDGWTGGGLSIRGLYNEVSGEVQIDLQERRTGAAIAAAASGNFPDTPVCTFTAPFRPQQTVPVIGQYAGGSGFAWVPFTGGLGPTGLLTLQSGAPNIALMPRTGSTDISLRALIRFTRKV